MAEPALSTTNNKSPPSKTTTGKDDKKAQLLRRVKIDSIVFLILVVVALVGVAMTNSTKTQAYLYWWILMGVEAVIVTAWAIWLSRQQELKKTVHVVLYEQLVLWGAALAAVFMIYRIMQIGQIDFNAAGLLMLLILAFATFIDGALVSWKLFIVSLIFIITLLFASYVEKFLWAMMILALAIAGGAIAFSYWSSHHTDKKEDQNLNTTAASQ